MNRCDIPLTCCDRVDQVWCLVTECERGVFTIVWVSLKFLSVLNTSAWSTDVAVSSTQNKDGEFVDAAPTVSAEEAILRAVEMAEPCCELAPSAKPDMELFKVLSSYPFSKYPQFHSIGWRGWVGW